MTVASEAHTGYPPQLQALLDRLNPYQVEAVNIGPGLACLAGVPGAGKTGTIVARIARMVADGFDPEYILAMTFTKAAASEMNERLKVLGILGARVGTIHSVCRQIVAAETHLFDEYSLDEKHRLPIELKKTLGDMRKKRKIPNYGVDLEGVSRFIEACKAKGVCYVYGDPFGLNMRSEEFILRQAEHWVPLAGLPRQQLLDVYLELERRRGIAGLYDFNDMLLWAWMQLLTDEESRLRWRSRWSVVIVDEVQDSHPIQWDISRFLVGLNSCMKPVCKVPGAPKVDDEAHNLMVGGDPSQCHPPGVSILTDDGVKAIECLGMCSTVKGWNRSAQKMIGGRKVKVASRPYEGQIHRVGVQLADGRRRCVPATSNHRFLCRWTDRTSKACVTYLMHRRDLGFRVGWCQLFTHRGEGDHGFHLAQRAKLEKADALWVLKVHEDRTEASVYESIVAARYGIPTVTFEPVRGAKHLTRAAIEKIFSETKETSRGLACLNDHNRGFYRPLWPWPNKPKGAYSRATYFEVFASNLLPELMSVPLPDERNAWAPIKSVETHWYVGPVYSLDVEKDHSYAVNGIVVLNSIYGWRSAEPGLFVQFSRRKDVHSVVLPINYRSNRMICAVGTGLVKGRPWHITGAIEAHSEDTRADAVEVVRYDDGEQEAAAIVQKCIENAGSGAGLRSSAVLSRLRVGLDLAEIECIRHRIKYIKMASGSFVESKAVRDILAYLRVASGNDPDGRWMGHIINTPFRYIGNQFRNKCAAYAEARAMSLLDAMLDNADDISFKQTRALRDLYKLLQRLNQLAVWAELREADFAEKLAAAKATGDPLTRAELGLDDLPVPPEVRDVMERATGRIDDKDLAEATAEELVEDYKSAGPAEMISLVLRETDYLEELRKEEGLVGMDESKAAMLSALQRMASSFHTTAAFLAYIDKLTVAVQQARRSGLKVKEGKQTDALVLSTIHRAKGLEWPNVYVMDVAAGRFPNVRAEDPDEELRLFYVAVTRAINKCEVSYAMAPEIEEDDEAPSMRDKPQKSPFILQIEREIALYAKGVTKSK